MISSKINSNVLFNIYKSLFDNNHDACYALDLEGNFILCNNATTKIFGYTQDEAHGMSIASIIHGKDLKKALYYFNSVKDGNSENFEIAIINKNGIKVDLYITIIPIIIESQVCGLVGMAKDISSKKNLETLLNGQNKALEMIAKGAPFKDVLNTIIEDIEKTSDGGICSILLVDQNKKVLVNGASPNLPNKYIETINKGIKIGPKMGSCGAAAYSKQITIVSDIANDRRWKGFEYITSKYNLKACWSSPVYDNHDNVLGTFAMYYNEERTPNELDLQIIEKATYLTSLAIQHYQTEAKVNFMAYHDSLTGLPNRRLFHEKATEDMNKISDDKAETLGLMYIDLDRFKIINDSLGHIVGDMLLVEIAKRLKKCVQEDDIVSRLGGDEFAIVLNNVTKQNVSHIAQKILNSLSQPFIIEGHEIFISPSIGISLYSRKEENITELLRKADVAMYQVKKDGRNNYRFYDIVFDKETFNKLEIENQLRKALERNEFHLVYQPIIDLSEKRITGFEALIRWDHPFLGQVPPCSFIPIAEESGVIISIGEWVLRTACQQLKHWENNGFPPLTVSVNISIRQFYQPNFIDTITRTINETKINPNHLTIEITESMTMDVETVTTILNKFKKIGVAISIDDFGTGYSSLSYLNKLPIDTLKIDKSFINDITNSKNDKNIAITIIHMAKSLGLNVIAEGVETNEQIAILKQHSCNEAQGYLISKPLPVDEIKSFLTTFSF
ncbi:MAG TPA: EAL domain-containing protein [Bacillus bacterium]|nr:EAL domain-containing protein [Bacillus sp. (in: firmicutes)]